MPKTLDQKRAYHKTYREHRTQRTGEKLDAPYLLDVCGDPLIALAAGVIWRAVDDLRLTRNPSPCELVSSSYDARAMAQEFLEGEWFAVLAEGVGFEVDFTRDLSRSIDTP